MKSIVARFTFLECVNAELKDCIERIASTEDGELTQQGSFLCPETTGAEHFGLLEGIEHGHKV